MWSLWGEREKLRLGRADEFVSLRLLRLLLHRLHLQSVSPQPRRWWWKRKQLCLVFFFSSFSSSSSSQSDSLFQSQTQTEGFDYPVIRWWWWWWSPSSNTSCSSFPIGGDYPLLRCTIFSLEEPSSSTRQRQHSSRSLFLRVICKWTSVAAVVVVLTDDSDSNDPPRQNEPGQAALSTVLFSFSLIYSGARATLLLPVLQRSLPRLTASSSVVVSSTTTAAAEVVCLTRSSRSSSLYLCSPVLIFWYLV